MIGNIFVGKTRNKRHDVSEIRLHVLGLCAVMLGMASKPACAADAAALVEPCVACHGEAGVSTEADVPSIAGYSEEYFSLSLDLYRSQDRPCVETEYRTGSRKGQKTDMCTIVASLSDSEIERMGEYFSGQKFVATPQTYDLELAKTGKAIHMAKCEECHSESGSLPDDNAGILRGQKMSYLREQINFVRTGKRYTSKKMKRRLDALGNVEIEALVNYYGSLRR